MNRTQRKVCCLALLLSCIPASAQSARQFVRQAVQTEMQLDRNDHSHWIYQEVDRKPDDTVTRWVAETSDGSLHRVVEKNGNPVSSADQQKAMDDFIHDTGAQAKQHKEGLHDDAQAAKLLKLLPQAFRWSDSGRRADGTMVLHFRPDPAFHPPDREARVFAAMAGDLAVDATQHRIVSIKGRLLHDVKFGGGLLGRLKAGGTFDVERRQVAKGKWQITASHVHMQGHALLFKTISEQEDDEKSHFTALPDDVSLQQAKSALLQQRNEQP